MAASVPERIEQRTNCTIYSRLDDRDGGSVEPDQTLAGGDKGDGGGGLLLKVNDDKKSNESAFRSSEMDSALLAFQSVRTRVGRGRRWAWCGTQKK